MFDFENTHCILYLKQIYHKIYTTDLTNINKIAALDNSIKIFAF